VSDPESQSSYELQPQASARSSPGGGLQHALVCVDGSHESECALYFGLAVADALGARVTCLRCLEPSPLSSQLPGPDALGWELARAQAWRSLEELRQRAAGPADAPAIEVELRLEEGHAASRILAVARGVSADLIVLGRHGEHGRRSGAPSGTAAEVLERTWTASLLVPCGPRRDSGQVALGRILVLLDGSQRAEYALETALRLAVAVSAELVVLHVLPPVELVGTAAVSADALELAERLRARNRLAAEDYLERLRARLAGAQVAVRTVLREEMLFESLHDLPLELKADLAVMCAHGASGSSRRALGGVVRHAIRYCQIPLLILQDLTARQVEQCDDGAAHETGGPRAGNVHFQATR